MRTGGTANQCGFTMVEIMVVLVVLAVVATMVTLNVTPASGHALQSTAEHLASSLEAARWRAVSNRQRIAWEPVLDSAGSAVQEAWYEQAEDGRWRPLSMPGAAAPAAGLSVTIGVPRPVTDTPARLVLGPEPVGTAACVLLTREGGALTVVSDGFTAFSVRRDGRC